MTVEGVAPKIVRLYARGATIPQLVVRFAITEDQVRRILRAAGHDVREEHT